MNSFIEQLNHWGEVVVPYAAQVLWQSSLLIIVLLALDLLLRNRVRAGVRYALWMLLLVKLVLPPSLALPTGAGYWVERNQPTAVAPLESTPLMVEQIVDAPAPAASSVVFEDVSELDFEMLIAMDAASTAQAAPPVPMPKVVVKPMPELSLNGWLLATWISIGVLLLGWMFWRWHWVNQLVRASVPAPTGLRELLSKVLPASCWQSGSTGMAGGGVPANQNDRGGSEAPRDRLEACPTLRITDAAMSPAVCGLFRPVILLPRKLVDQLSPEHLRTILLHELIHLRRRDLWVNCVQTLFQIACWWHPLLWLANSRIRRVREEAVDEAVAATLRDGADVYPATLLEVAKLTFTRPLMTLGLVGILESKNALKQRIRRLVEMPPLESARIKWWQWMAVLALALVSLPMAQGKFPQAEPAPAELDSTSERATEPLAQAVESELSPTPDEAPTIETPGSTNQSDTNSGYEFVGGTALELSKLRNENFEVRFANLSNLLVTADKEFQREERKLDALRPTLTMPEVWLLSAGVQNDPFVKRHIKALGLNPPEEIVEAMNDVKEARNRRDLAEMKFVQESINHEFEQQGKADARSMKEKYSAGFASISNRLVQAEAEMKVSQSKVKTMTVELGSDPFADPIRIYPKDEFLKLIPLVEATLEMNRQSNVWRAVRMQMEQAEAAFRESKTTGEKGSVASWLVHDPSASQSPPDETSPERQAIMKKLYGITLDEVVYKKMPLSEVVKNLTDEIRRRDPEHVGINFLIVSGVDAPVHGPTVATAFIADPTTGLAVRVQADGGVPVDIGSAIIDFSSPLKDVRLVDVLDATASLADMPIKYTVENYAVVFSLNIPESERLFTRTIKVNPNTFYQALDDVFANSLSRSEGQAPSGASRTVVTNVSTASSALLDYFESAGVNLVAPKMLYFNDRTGLLMIRATLEDLEIIQQAVEVLNYEPPQITLTVRTVELSTEHVKSLAEKIPSFLLSTADSSRPNAVPQMSTVNAILTKKQAESIESELYKLGTVSINMNGGPRVTTLSGNQTQIKSGPLLTNVVMSVTNAPNGPVYLSEDVRLGSVWDFTPQVMADSYTIHLPVAFHYTEFLGYDDPATVGKPAGTPLPKFSVGKADADVMVWDGQTVALGGMTIQKPGKNGDTETRHILAFITPEIIDPAGNLVNNPDEMPFARDAIPPQPAEK